MEKPHFWGNAAGINNLLLKLKRKVRFDVQIIHR